MYTATCTTLVNIEHLLYMTSNKLLYKQMIYRYELVIKQSNLHRLHFLDHFKKTRWSNKHLYSKSLSNHVNYQSIPPHCQLVSEKVNHRILYKSWSRHTCWTDDNYNFM